MTPQNLLITLVLTILFFAFKSCFKNDKKRGIKISRVKDYTPPTKQDLNLCKAIQQSNTAYTPPTKILNQRQKRKLKKQSNNYRF
jgi:hypothetical protein